MDAARDDVGIGRFTASSKGMVPGVATAVLGCVAALLISAVGPAVGALTVAVLLGILVGPFLPTGTRPGLSWATRRFLRTGVVLLGLQLGLEQVIGLGVGMVLAVVAVVALGFAGSLLLGRLLGVSRDLALMVATGSSICGASAIAAVDSVTESDKRDVATAIALVTLYGSAAMLAVPVIGGWMGLSPTQIGAWSGASVHEVAQVVAAASPAGAAAVGVAVVVKLTRVVLLAPVVAGVGVVARRRRARAGPGK